MNEDRFSVTQVIFCLYLVQSGRLFTKGETPLCTFGTECDKHAITLICNFPADANNSERLTVKQGNNRIIIDQDGKGTLKTVDSRYIVTYNPITVWIAYASQTDAGTYVCDMPRRRNFKSTCSLTEENIDALKNCGAGGARMTSTPPSVSDSANEDLSSSSDLSVSSTSDKHDADVGAGFGAGVGVGVGVGVLLFLAVIVIIICRRRYKRRLKKKADLHHAPSEAQNCVYSSVLSNVENSSVKNADKSKRKDIIEELKRRVSSILCFQVETPNVLSKLKAHMRDKNSSTYREDKENSTEDRTNPGQVYSPFCSATDENVQIIDSQSARTAAEIQKAKDLEVLPQLTEKPDSGNSDDQVLHGVIELLKGLTNSPGGSDSPADTTDKAATEKGNVTTLVLCRRGVDGSFELSIQNSLCTLDSYSQKEPAIAEQEPDRLESPLEAFPVAYRDRDMKIITSVNVQEQIAPDVHDTLKNRIHDKQESHETESDSVDLKGARKMKGEDIPEVDRLGNPFCVRNFRAKFRKQNAGFYQKSSLKQM